MIIQKKVTNVKKIVMSCMVAVFGLTASFAATPTSYATDVNGFDELGLNVNAQMANGTYREGVMILQGQDIGEEHAYANDHFVMNWNDAWANCVTGSMQDIYDDASICAGAVLTWQRNGFVTGGSNSNEHFKIIWSHSCAISDTPSNAEYCEGSFETLTLQGVSEGVHSHSVKVTPSGLGLAKKIQEATN